MSADDDGKAGLRREWVASVDTNLKASPAHSNTLPDGEKLRVSRGATLTATFIDEDQGYWTIADGVLDGVAIPAHIRLVFTAHWRLLPVPTAQAAPAEADEPSDAASASAIEPEPVAMPAPQAPSTAAITAETSGKESTLLCQKDLPKPPSHRRFFASFKRRLNRK